MKITKFGHCCLLIEENSTRILTDPGAWSKIPDDLINLDAIVITHEHGDHLHLESIDKLIEQNPNCKIYGNNSVKNKLAEKNFDFVIIEEGQSQQINGMKISGYGNLHAFIHPDFKKFQNTGFLFNEKLFYPGDALTIIDKEVDILALPVAGPWVKVAEAIDYAKEIKPRIAFPVHDGNLKEFGSEHGAPTLLLDQVGIKFIVLENSKEYDL